jgi:hypothetical protein
LSGRIPLVALPGLFTRIERVNDDRPLTRLDMLRFARRVVEHQAARQLALMDRWIADEERREAERERRLATRQAAPDWLIERGLNGRTAVYVHVGGCASAGGRAKGASRDQAVRALTEGEIAACPLCRPDTALGILE